MSALYITQGLRGGQGKSLVAYLIAKTFEAQKLDYEFAEIDVVNKLSIMLPHKKPFLVKEMAPALDDSLTKADLVGFYNPVLGLLNHENALLDLGAGVSRTFQDWMKTVDFKDIRINSFLIYFFDLLIGFPCANRAG